MNIRIIQVILDVFDHYGENIRFEEERFEEALNDEAPDLLDECFWIIRGFQTGIYDAMIFDEDIYRNGYVKYLMENIECEEKEAIFIVAVFETVITEISYYFEIPDMLSLLQDAYERQDYPQLAIIAKTYFLGFGVSQDYEKAFEIYSYLYGHGDDCGAYYLGFMYEHGYGIEQDIEKVLYSEEEIIAKTKELGTQLTKDYEGKNPLLIGVLKGSVPFMAELIKHIDTHVEIDFMVVSSYHGGVKSSGEVKILKDVDTNIEGRDVVFIEDIIDTGRTLKYLRDMFKYRKANSVKIATLFDKPEGRVVDIEADYVCYDVPNEFIVGFGLDYAERYRNLPYVGVLKEEIYSN